MDLKVKGISYLSIWIDSKLVVLSVVFTDNF